MTNQCYFKLHTICSQRASLISKDVLNLSQFFIEGSRADTGPLASELTIHKLVIIDEVGLRHLYDFDRDDERDGDHGIEQDQIGAEHEETIAYGRMRSPEDVSISVGVILEKVTVECAKDDTKNNLESQDEAQNVVYFLLDLRHLIGLALRIHHDLAVPTSVDHQPVNPLSVLQTCLTIEQLLILPKSDVCMRWTFHPQCRVKLVQLLIRNNPIKIPSKICQHLHSVVSLRLMKSASRLEVFLAIKTGSFYEGTSIVKGRTQQHHISWKTVLLLDVANIPNNHVTPLHFHQLPVTEHSRLLLMVQNLVRSISLVIFVT